MKINVTVGELLKMARSCLHACGCSECVLNDYCTGYENLENLVEIEGNKAAEPVAVPTLTNPVEEWMPIPKDEPDNQTDGTCVSSGKIGGVERTVDEMVDDILSAGSGKPKRKSNNKEASETKARVRKLLAEGVGEYGDEFIDRLYAVGEGTIERKELLGMVSGIKYPIELWRIAEQVYNDAGY